MQTQEFYSHGKLLLTGEYVVLDGAEALALPCKFGQFLKVKPIKGHQFQWTSYLKNGEVWQDLKFSLEDVLKPAKSDNFKNRLFQILKAIYKLKPNLFDQAYNFSTHLEFDKNWGLGSSSTLINNLSTWAEIDAHGLLAQTFGGSGYDIAAAKMQSAFFYKKIDNHVFATETEIANSLKPHIYFVYLNQKQNSREAIIAYQKISTEKKHNKIKIISKLTHDIANASSLKTFEKLLNDHEQILSKLINQKPVQDLRFKDYKAGIIKSLGAWGGDFVLVTAQHVEDLKYFRGKGFETIFSYKEIAY